MVENIYTYFQDSSVYSEIDIAIFLMGLSHTGTIGIDEMQFLFTVLLENTDVRGVMPKAQEKLKTFFEINNLLIETNNGTISMKPAVVTIEWLDKAHVSLCDITGVSYKYMFQELEYDFINRTNNVQFYNTIKEDEVWLSKKYSDYERSLVKNGVIAGVSIDKLDIKNVTDEHHGNYIMQDFVESYNFIKIDDYVFSRTIGNFCLTNIKSALFTDSLVCIKNVADEQLDEFKQTKIKYSQSTMSFVLTYEQYKHKVPSPELITMYDVPCDNLWVTDYENKQVLRI